jgi:hypothetical protein
MTTHHTKKQNDPISTDELRNKIDSLFAPPMSTEEQGKVHTETLLAYLGIKKEIDTSYLATLTEGIEALKKLNGEEKTNTTRLETEIVRQKLQEIDDLD